MEYELKFTGSFKNLKKLGYEFMKLYASNYKVYYKKLDSGKKLWVWVANGGYIEMDDCYEHTKSIIEKLKEVDWSTISARKSFDKSTYKSVCVQYNHSEPENGYVVSEVSLDNKYWKYQMEHDCSWEEAREATKTFHDTEKVFYEETWKELLTELETINK